jgi:hypothetical protein
MDPFHGCGCEHRYREEGVAHLDIFQVRIGFQKGFLIHVGSIHDEDGERTEFPQGTAIMG